MGLPAAPVLSPACAAIACRRCATMGGNFTSHSFLSDEETSTAELLDMWENCGACESGSGAAMLEMAHQCGRAMTQWPEFVQRCSPRSCARLR